MSVGFETKAGLIIMVSTICCRVIAIALFISAILTVATQAQEIKVTLLGTGNPPPVMNRFRP